MIKVTMAGQYSVNPALATRWFTIKNGLKYKMKVIGTYFIGSRENFKITEYELQYTHTKETQVIKAEVLLKYIDEGIVKPDYNENGSLIHE